ncbi:MAG: hypothetical protein FGM33_06280 [Candidatus Kapabacteria bacterium]|nr:hypothetical protein [Candidatus Kapabacteria bacterium]
MRCIRPPGSSSVAAKSADQVHGIVLEVHRFRLKIHDATGFFSDPTRWEQQTLGARRLQVLESVFSDIAFAVNARHRIGRIWDDSNKCVIDIETISDRSEPAAGWAEPTFIIGPAENAVIVDVAPLSLLRDSIKPPREMHELMGTHGRIVLNTRFTFGVEQNGCPPDAVDLYSVLLHELLHVLGMASIVGLECQPTGSRAKQTYASRWDALLHVRDEQPMITFECGSLLSVLPDGIGGAAAVVTPTNAPHGGFQITGASPADGCVYDLSHLLPSKPGDSVIMLASIGKGQTRRDLQDAELRCLLALGYAVPENMLIPTKRITGVATGRTDTVKMTAVEPRRHTVHRSAISLLARSAEKLLCVSPAVADPRIELLSEGDSIVIVAGGNLVRNLPVRCHILDSAARPSSFLCYLQFGARTSLGIDDLPCPPNTICNGGFEVAARWGRIVPNVFDGRFCGHRTMLANWRTDEGSAELFRDEIPTPYIDDNSDPNYSIAGQGSRRPMPRRRDAGSDNRAYVGGLSHGATGGPPDYYEGISQRVYCTAGSSFRIGLWAYTFEYPHIVYTRNAALWVSVADTGECTVTRCDQVRGNILNQVLVLPHPNVWLPMWSSTVRIPRDGWYTITISTTNCFLASPQYGQGTTGWVGFDDVKLCARSLSTEAWLVPNAPCQGDTVSAITTFTNMSDEPTRVDWVAEGFDGAVVVGAKQGYVDLPPGATRELPLTRVRADQLPGSKAGVRIISRDQGTADIADTVVAYCTIGSGPLSMKVQSGRTDSDGIRAVVDVSCRRTSATPVQGVITWQYAILDSVELQLEDTTVFRIDTIRRTNSDLALHISGRLNQTGSPVRIIVNGRRIRSQTRSAFSDERLTLLFRTSASSCDAAAIVEPGGELLRVDPAPGVVLRPNPASDIIRVDFDQSIGAPIQYRIVSIDGRQLQVDTPNDASAGWFPVNVSPLCNGSYWVIIEGSSRTTAVPFVVLR